MKNITCFLSILLLPAVFSSPADSGMSRDLPSMSGLMDTLQTRASDVPAVPEPAREPGETELDLRNGDVVIQGNINNNYIRLTVGQSQISGNVNGAYCNIWHDRNNGIISGNANGSYVHLSYDLASGIIEGNANDSYWRLHIDRASGIVEGNANGSYVRLYYDRASGMVEGNANGSYVRLMISQDGTINGNANGSYVRLWIDPAAGRVEGNVNGAYANLSVSGGKEAVMRTLTLSESSVIDALLLRLPLNLFAF